MTFDPQRGHASLRRGRTSIPHAEYFLTVCLKDRRQGLTEKIPSEGVISELNKMEADGTWIIRCATIMPDHLHLIVILGTRLSLGQSVQRLKAKTTEVLRTLGMQWEHNFFERQLREKDERAPIFLYIFLNPYRKKLCSATIAWPGFVCRKEDWAWFRDQLNNSLPQPEWLA